MNKSASSLAISASTLADPLRYLEARVVARFPEIESWLHSEFLKTQSPLYFSVDLRNNGHKIVPIDTNLFPGGFNNLGPSSYGLAIEAFKRRIYELCPGAKKILLVPERHTRNAFYLDNVAVLQYLLESAGIAVKVGLTGIAKPLSLKSGRGADLVIDPVVRSGNRLVVGDFEPCAIVLNNDLTSENMEEFQGLAIPVMPDPSAGWQTRRKSSHFYQYERVAARFAEVIDFDPWFITPSFSVCGKVNVGMSEGLDCLATASDETLCDLAENYRKHGIKEDPFVVVKADAGTYGMGVFTVRSVQDIYAMNRKSRKELSVAKGGMPIRDMLIQEGIHTVDQMGGVTAEPVVYGVDGTVVGGFYRMNARRARDENLNSPGMAFTPLPFDTASRPPGPFDSEGEREGFSRLYVYGVVARMAALAAAKEFQG